MNECHVSRKCSDQSAFADMKHLTGFDTVFFVIEKLVDYQHHNNIDCRTDYEFTVKSASGDSIEQLSSHPCDVLSISALK